LADTITDASDDALADGTATGFSFQEYTAAALSQTLRRAEATYREQGDVWRRIVAGGMRQDWSWSRSAQRYVELYRQTVAARRQAPASASR
jgi:starch synthase